MDKQAAESSGRNALAREFLKHVYGMRPDELAGLMPESATHKNNTLVLCEFNDVDRIICVREHMDPRQLLNRRSR